MTRDPCEGLAEEAAGVGANRLARYQYARPPEEGEAKFEMVQTAVTVKRVTRQRAESDVYELECFEH